MVKLKGSQALGDFLQVIKLQIWDHNLAPPHYRTILPDICKFPLSSDLAQVRMSLIFLASLLKIMSLLQGSVPCELPELGVEGSVAKCHIIPSS